MPDFTLKSGALLTVSMAAFEIGNALRKSVSRATKEESDILGDRSLRAMITDDEVERQVFLCAQSAIYAGVKVNRALFDDPQLGVQARGDYFEIFATIVSVNVSPFFLNISESSTKQGDAEPSRVSS